MAVVAAVLGHRGRLGSVVARRWAEHGADVRTTETRDLAEIAAFAKDADVIVNCARGGLLTDALLPLLLADVGHLIQPSSDVIGEVSWYATAKRISERARAVVIRCSLVADEQPPDVGYINWTWNGITTLSWADLAWREWRTPPTLIVPTSPTVSRYDLYVAVADVLGYRFPEPQPGPGFKDRALVGNRDFPPIREQLVALREWRA